MHWQKKIADIRSATMATLWTQRLRHHIREGFPSVDKFMIGRGLIKRPWLLEELSGGRQEKQERKERFLQFHNAILEGYRQQMSGTKYLI